MIAESLDECRFTVVLVLSSVWWKHSAPPKHYIDDQSWGMLHTFHGIHRASRNYTLKARVMCVIDGDGHHIEKLWEIQFTVSLHKIYVMRSGPLH